jgi:putative transcriptional regulator
MGRVNDLADGRLLIARRSLPDPNFESAVVLLIHYDKEKGAMGLVLNRRTTLPIYRVFPDRAELRSRKDTVFSGGPVERSAVFALLRSSEKPSTAQRVINDVYLVTAKVDLDKAAGGSNEFRVFLGYSGWSPSQLEREVEIGTWHILPAETKLVFDSEPETMWMRLIARTEMRMAFQPHSYRSVIIGSTRDALRAGM